MSTNYDREYWARRHYDQQVADHYDELYGESARGLREANIRIRARLAMMTPEERAANDASALRDMGEYCCPKHLTGADRESWIAARTAHIHAMRAGTAELWDFHWSGGPNNAGRQLVGRSAAEPVAAPIVVPAPSPAVRQLHLFDR